MHVVFHINVVQCLDLIHYSVLNKLWFLKDDNSVLNLSMSCIPSLPESDPLTSLS